MIIKGLSLLQPWASLVAGKQKMWETRSIHWSYTGPIAIHASANRASGKEWFEDPTFQEALGRMGLRHWWALPFGKVLAIARIVECMPTVQAAKLVSDEELCFGNYEPGRWAYRLEVLKRLEPAVTRRGARGLWDWEVPEKYYPVIERTNGIIEPTRPVSTSSHSSVSKP